MLENPKFSFSLKSLQIHSKHQKLVPNHCVTLGKWLWSTFDNWNEFKTIFGKSNFGAQKAFFPYWRLRRLQNQAFHGPQNMVGACSKWAFWRHYDRQSNFTYILEELPIQIFDLCIKYAWHPRKNARKMDAILTFWKHFQKWGL